MSAIHTIEQSPAARRFTFINTAIRARRKIIALRTRGIHDQIFGWIPDRRPPPSLLGIIVDIQLRKVERSIENLVEWGQH